MNAAWTYEEINAPYVQARDAGKTGRSARLGLGSLNAGGCPGSRKALDSDGLLSRDGYASIGRRLILSHRLLALGGRGGGHDVTEHFPSCIFYMTNHV